MEPRGLTEKEAQDLADWFGIKKWVVVAAPIRWWVRLLNYLEFACFLALIPCVAVLFIALFILCFPFYVIGGVFSDE